MVSISAVTIGDRELDPHLELATAKLLGFRHRASTGDAAPPPEPASARLRGRSIAYRPLQRLDPAATGATETREWSLVERVREIHPRDDLYTDVEHHVLRVIRRGIQLYYQIFQAYEQASGLERLKAVNRDGGLEARLVPELNAKLETASAASLFALACYVLARLEDYEREASEALSAGIDAPEELGLGGRSNALHAGLHYIYAAIDRHARDDASLVATVREAARELARRLQAVQHSLEHLDFYTRYHFRVEPEEVRIAGFELPELRRGSDILVPTRRPGDVVGNHIAKLEAQRIAQRLACYDAERQSNPFVELGGFVFTFIGDGSPGTGKTTLIQMMVTLLREYAQVAGLPLRYRNFSIDEISDYQGRSGQNAKHFCRELLDPRVVAFGSIDDVDQVCGNRNDRNASAGQLEVTAVFMQEFAGANTVVRGNTSFGLFSNYPEKVDDALRQRMQSRFLVDGPKTQADFSDLLHILLSRDFSLAPGEGYEPLAAQRVREVVREKYDEYDRPSSPELRALFSRTLGGNIEAGEALDWSDFGAYLHALFLHDDRFTGRAIKNIADGVRARIMDFDIPAHWLEDRATFFAKPWDTRVSMLEELRGTITPELVIQEINRYAESETRYASAAARRELDERTRNILLDARARKAAAERET